MENARSILILMGSDSDLPIMSQAADALESLGVRCELHVCSAHRSPERALELARGARARGFSAIIAGAGMSAHLPGVVAAVTTLPVIGVPLNASPLGGQDSLLSIVQMPPGVPVATVGIGAAKNAGLLAAQVIGAHDAAVAERLEAFKREMAAKVAQADARLQRARDENLSADTTTPRAGAPPGLAPSTSRLTGATST